MKRQSSDARGARQGVKDGYGAVMVIVRIPVVKPSSAAIVGVLPEDKGQSKLNALPITPTVIVPLTSIIPMVLSFSVPNTSTESMLTTGGVVSPEPPAR